MDAAYFQAAIPEPCIIFGLRLLPLSIGRYRLLQRFGCAFVADQESAATMEDLVLGIVICSMRVDEFIEFVQAWNFTTEMKRLGRRIRREMRNDERFSLLSKFGLFQRYILDSSKCPKYWDEHEDRPASGAHWSHNVEIVLRSGLGYSLEEINEAPLSKALADYFKHAENQGALRLMTQEEIAQGEANARLFEALAKGGSCPGSN